MDAFHPPPQSHGSAPVAPPTSDPPYQVSCLAVSPSKHLAVLHTAYARTHAVATPTRMRHRPCLPSLIHGEHSTQDTMCHITSRPQERSIPATTTTRRLTWHVPVCGVRVRHGGLGRYRRRAAGDAGGEAGLVRRGKVCAVLCRRHPALLSAIRVSVPALIKQRDKVSFAGSRITAK